jgi:hypothetical protein
MPLTRANILVMTLGFFGNSFGFGIVFSAVNPLFHLDRGETGAAADPQYRRPHYGLVHPAAHPCDQ